MAGGKFLGVYEKWVIRTTKYCTCETYTAKIFSSYFHALKCYKYKPMYIASSQKWDKSQDKPESKTLVRFLLRAICIVSKKLQCVKSEVAQG